MRRADWPRLIRGSRVAFVSILISDFTTARLYLARFMLMLADNDSLRAYHPWEGYATQAKAHPDKSWIWVLAIGLPQTPMGDLILFLGEGTNRKQLVFVADEIR